MAIEGSLWWNSPIKLSDWARQNGIPYKAAWKWWRDGKPPIPAKQMPTGTILMEIPGSSVAPGVDLYARVSSRDQKPDPDRQGARLSMFAAEGGLRVEKVVAEVGSGLNGHRKELMSVLRTPR